MLLIVILQACTCFGVPIEEYFPSLALSSQTELISIATPTSTPRPLPSATPAGMNCADLRLTSPLDGLPNGMVTFYWDTLPGAVNYRINLYAEDVEGQPWLAGFEAGADQTNLSANVGTGAIGGQYAFRVEFIAEDEQGQQCSQVFSLFRAAAPPHIDQSPPTATPTCEENPGGNYC